MDRSGPFSFPNGLIILDTHPPPSSDGHRSIGLDGKERKDTHTHTYHHLPVQTASPFLLFVHSKWIHHMRKRGSLYHFCVVYIDMSSSRGEEDHTVQRVWKRYISHAWDGLCQTRNLPLSSSCLAPSSCSPPRFLLFNVIHTPPTASMTVENHLSSLFLGTVDIRERENVCDPHILVSPYQNENNDAISRTYPSLSLLYLRRAMEMGKERNPWALPEKGRDPLLFVFLQ